MNWSHICSFVRATGIFCLVMTFAGSIATADLVYTITGTIPVGGSGNSQVSDGESFIATFYIDTSVPDGLPGDPNIGLYNGATTGGSLVFSGGYFSPLDFSGYDISIADNATSGDGSVGPLDAISISNSFGTNNPNIFQAGTSIEIGSFISDGLPMPGTSLQSGPDPDTLTWREFEYEDINGLIKWNGTVSHSNLFRASVPEPGSSALFIAAVLLLNTRRRRPN